MFFWDIWDVSVQAVAIQLEMCDCDCRTLICTPHLNLFPIIVFFIRPVPTCSGCELVALAELFCARREDEHFGLKTEFDPKNRCRKKH